MKNRMGHVILENPLRSVYKKGLELLETVQTVKYSQERRIAGDGLQVLMTLLVS